MLIVFHFINNFNYGDKQTNLNEARLIIKYTENQNEERFLF